METTTFKENGAIEDVKKDIVTQLNDYKGVKVYGCDLAYKLFEGDNANGSVFCNAYKTEQYIKANWDLFGELVEHCKNNMDMSINPFSEPEKCHVIFELEAAQGILSGCPTVEANWNDKIELTDEMIKQIAEEVTAFDGNVF